MIVISTWLLRILELSLNASAPKSHSMLHKGIFNLQTHNVSNGPKLHIESLVASMDNDDGDCRGLFQDNSSRYAW